MSDPFYTIEQYGGDTEPSFRGLALNRLHQLAVAERDAWEAAVGVPGEYVASRSYWDGYVEAIEKVMALVGEKPPWTVTVKKGAK